MPTRVQVEVQRLHAELPPPAYAREGDAGLDLRAAETVTLPPGGCALVGTGIALAIPGGFARWGRWTGRRPGTPVRAPRHPGATPAGGPGAR
jgi:hypothetical protein